MNSNAFTAPASFSVRRGRSGGRPWLVLALTCQLLAILAFAQQPSWWSSRGIIKPMAEPMDYAMANQGQLKNFARAARDEMLQKQLIQEGHAIDLMVRAWIDSPDNALDFGAVNQGQLKTVAKPFYDQLVLLGLRPQYPRYPWPSESDADFVAVNIGQLKNVFAFAIPSFTLKALKYQQVVELGMTSPHGIWVRLEQEGQPVQAAAVNFEVHQSAGGLLPSSNLQGVPQATIQSTTNAQGFAGCQFRAPLQPAYCWIKATTAQIAPVWFLMIVGGGDGDFPSNPSGVDGVDYAEDSDGDGDTDAEELAAGNDPKNPSSHSPDWKHWSLVTHLHHDYDQWYALNSSEWQSNPNDPSTWHWFGFRTSLLQGVLYNPSPEDLGTTVKPPVSAYPVLNVSTMPPLLSPGWQEGGSAKWTNQNAIPYGIVTDWYTSSGETDGVTDGQLIPSRSWSAQALKVEIKTARVRPYDQNWVMLVQQGTGRQVIETRTLTIPAGSSSTGPMVIYYPPVLEQFNSYSINLLPVEVNCPELYMFSGHTGDKVELCKVSGIACEWKLKDATPAIGTFDHPTDTACSFTATTKGKNTIQLVMGGNVVWEKPTEVIEIVTRAVWGAVAPNASTQTMPDFQHVTLHHSSNTNTGVAEMQRIQRKHMSLFPYALSFGPFEGFDFDDIGYHFVMDKSGVVYEGRQLEAAPGTPGGPYTKGEHVGGNNTVAGIGFCTMGDYEVTEGNEAWPATRQKGLEKAVSALCRRYKIPSSKLSYHKAMAPATSPRTCPGSNFIPAMPHIIKHVNENLQ